MPTNSAGLIAIVVDVVGEATHEFSTQDTAAHVSDIPSGGTLLKLPGSLPSDGDSYEFADIDGSCGPGNPLKITDPNGHLIAGSATQSFTTPFVSGFVRYNAKARVWALLSSSGAGSSSGGVLGFDAVGDSLFGEVGIDKTLVPAGTSLTLFANPALVAQASAVITGPAALQNGEQETIAALVNVTSTTTSDEGHFEDRVTYFNNGLTVENPQGGTSGTDVTTPPPLQNVGPGSSLNVVAVSFTVIGGVPSLVVDNTAVGAIDVEAAASVSLMRNSLGPAGQAPSLASAIFTPNHGPISGGTTVIVTNASGMSNRMVGVFVGGVAAVFAPISDSSFSFVTPAGVAVGNVDVEVATRGGNATASAVFHYDFTPIVRSPLFWAKYSVAGSVTVVGPNATAVADLSGHADDLNAGGPNAYTASDAHVTPPAPSIASSATGLHNLASYPQPNTTYVIGYATAGGPSDFVGSADGVPGDRQSIGVNGAVWYQYAGGIVESGGTVDANAHVFCAVFDGVSSAVYIDSSLVAVFSGNVGANDLVQLCLGGSGNAGGVSTFEIIVVAGADDGTQRGQIFTYAGSDYGKPWS